MRLEGEYEEEWARLEEMLREKVWILRQKTNYIVCIFLWESIMIRRQEAAEAIFRRTSRNITRTKRCAGYGEKKKQSVFICFYEARSNMTNLYTIFEKSGCSGILYENTRSRGVCGKRM